MLEDTDANVSFFLLIDSNLALISFFGQKSGKLGENISHHPILCSLTHMAVGLLQSDQSTSFTTVIKIKRFHPVVWAKVLTW